MNKATAVLSTVIQAVTEVAPAASAVEMTAPAVAARPSIIRFTESTNLAFAIAAHHIRNGYRFSVDYAPEIFASHGQSSIVLELGNPDQFAITAAEAAMTLAVDRQRAEYELAVESAARQMMADAERKAKRKAAAAEVAEAEKALRKLKAAAASI
jgi:hypothetical protein